MTRGQEKTPGDGTGGSPEFINRNELQPKRSRSRRQNRRPKPRCTCSLYGICPTCEGIRDRRIAAELRRRRS